MWCPCILCRLWSRRRRRAACLLSVPAVAMALAAGTVAFAGPVARSLFITLDHGGGVTSTYSYLQRISVRAGAGVARGQVIGIAGERLHFGVRLKGAYTDPTGFIGLRRVRVRLVPL